MRPLKWSCQNLPHQLVGVPLCTAIKKFGGCRNGRRVKCCRESKVCRESKAFDTATTGHAIMLTRPPGGMCDGRLVRFLRLSAAAVARASVRVRETGGGDTASNGTAAFWGTNGHVYSGFSNRPFRVKRFQTIHHSSVDVAHGLVLLFGIGTRGPSIMGFEDEAEQSIGRPCRHCDDRSKRTCELTSSIVPRGTSFHRSVELECPSIGLDTARFSCCCCGLFSGPAELGAVNPYAVHNYSQPACQGHDRLFHPAAPGDLHRPGFEPRPFLRPQHALSCFVEHDPHHLISAA
jgi:hypothetical protein